MTGEELEFIDFCIFILAEKLNKPVQEIYKLLTKDTDLLETYIKPCYDVLHTQGKEYIIAEILEAFNERGINLWGYIMEAQLL